ncbi:MAG: transposase [Synechococcales cyanobacterium M58_A2018_015]|nr:transposase [Synechococcales cyanobacterium M58_A2018_015]
MPRRRRPEDKIDQLLDELLADYSSLEQILGVQGLLKQLTKRVVERALQAEWSHHLQSKTEPVPSEPDRPGKRQNSRNGYSAKTVKGYLAAPIPRPLYGLAD